MSTTCYYNIEQRRNGEIRSDPVAVDASQLVSYYSSLSPLDSVRQIRQAAIDSLDVKRKLTVFLCDVWLWGFSDANWADFSYPGLSNDDIRWFVMTSVDGFIKRVTQLKTQQELEALNEDIQAFIKADLKYRVNIDEHVASMGSSGAAAYRALYNPSLISSTLPLSKVLDEAPAVLTEPYTSLIFYSDKIAGSVEMGMAIDPVENYAIAYEAPEELRKEILENRLPDFAHEIKTLISSMNEAKMELFKYYRDQGYAARGLANILNVLGDGDLVAIAAAQECLDAMIGRLTAATTPQQCQSVVDELYVLMCPGGKLNTALQMVLSLEKTNLLSSLQFAITGFAVKLAMVTGSMVLQGSRVLLGMEAASATTAATAGAATAEQGVTLAKAVTQRVVQGAEAGRNVAVLVTANNILDAAAGSGSQRHTTYDEWATQALASGLAGTLMSFTPVAHGGLLNRYMGDGALKNVLVDQVMEFPEEMVDGAISNWLQGKDNMTMYETQETIRSTALGGFMQAGASRELFGNSENAQDAFISMSHSDENQDAGLTSIVGEETTNKDAPTLTGNDESSDASQETLYDIPASANNNNYAQEQHNFTELPDAANNNTGYFGDAMTQNGLEAAVRELSAQNPDAEFTIYYNRQARGWVIAQGDGATHFMGETVAWYDSWGKTPVPGTRRTP